MWVDGSFLTEKDKPSDIDVTVFIDIDILNELTDEQKELVDKSNEIGYIEGLDSFVITRYPRGHPMYGTEEDIAYSWHEVYGSENGKEWLKGFAVLMLGDSHA